MITGVVVASMKCFGYRCWGQAHSTVNAFNTTELDICECFVEKYLLIIVCFKIYIWKTCLPVCVGLGRTQWLWVWKDVEDHGGIPCISSSRYSVSYFTGSEYTISCVCLFLSSGFMNRFAAWSQCWSPTALSTSDSTTCKLVHESPMMDFYSWVFPNLYPHTQFCNEYREGNVIFTNITWCISVRRVKGDKGPWRGVVAGTDRNWQALL